MGLGPALECFDQGDLRIMAGLSFSDRVNDVARWCANCDHPSEDGKPFRTSLLRPDQFITSLDVNDRLFMSYNRSLAVSADVVCAIAEKRHVLLKERPAFQPEEGRLLVCEPSMSFGSMLACGDSDFFFDEDDLPGWDLWVGFFMEPDNLPIWQMEPHKVPHPARLIAWVPERWIVRCNDGIKVCETGCIYWLKESDFAMVANLVN
jgi:hypothetical protein